jgi:hypothetical protein
MNGLFKALVAKRNERKNSKYILADRNISRRRFVSESLSQTLTYVRAEGKQMTRLRHCSKLNV